MTDPTNLKKSLLAILKSHEPDCSHTRGVPATEYKYLIADLTTFINAGHEAEFLRGKFVGFEDGLKINGDLNSR